MKNLMYSLQLFLLFVQYHFNETKLFDDTSILPFRRGKNGSLQ
jgi:hypothetical protein